MKQHEMLALNAVIRSVRASTPNNAQAHEGELFYTTSFELADGSRLEIGCADFDWCGNQDLCEGSEVGLIIKHLP